jgi:hypothetical protein
VPTESCLLHVRHAIPSVPRRELLRAKPDNIFCSTLIQSLPASTLLSVVVSCASREVLYLVSLFNDAGTVPRLRRLIAGPLTQEARVRNQTSLCGICGWHIGTETGFSQTTAFLPCQGCGYAPQTFPHNFQTVSGAHPGSSSLGIGFLSRKKSGWGVNLTLNSIQCRR